MLVLRQDLEWWADLADKLELAVVSVPHGTGDSSFLRVSHQIALEHAGKRERGRFGVPPRREPDVV